MDAKEFYDLVVEMRKAQKDYFHGHTSEALGRVKKYEQAVDNEISRMKRLSESRGGYQQLNLFEDD